VAEEKGTGDARVRSKYNGKLGNICQSSSPGLTVEAGHFEAIPWHGIPAKDLSDMLLGLTKTEGQALFTSSFLLHRSLWGLRPPRGSNYNGAGLCWVVAASGRMGWYD